MVQPMLERDFLYPTENEYEPDSVHISVLHPERDGKIPIIIEPKTEHDPLHYITDIVSLIQAEVFERVRIDIKKCGIFFFKAGGNRFCRVVYQGGDRYVSEFVEGLQASGLIC
jgi:hypothetical protein